VVKKKKMTDDKIKIELKSEVLNEVLSSPPSWLVRSGNTLFFFMILMLLVMSWMISYPDETLGKVTIYSNRPPVEFQNQLYGKLVDVRVVDNQWVKQGQILAQFNNEINPQHIQLVKSFLDTLSLKYNNDVIVLPQGVRDVDLVTLNESWTNLLSFINEWNSLKSSNLMEEKEKALEVEIKQRENLNWISRQKLTLIEKDIRFQQDKIRSTKRLLDKGAVSMQEYRKEEQLENQLQQQLQNQKEALIQNEIQLNNLNKIFLESSFNSGQQVEKLKSSIQNSVSVIQNQIQEWEKNVAWIAPFDGHVVFNKNLHISSFYQVGEASMMIVPRGSFYTASVVVPSNGSGKIEKNQKVLIELSDYPKNEYGMIQGSVKSITSVSKKDTYEVEVKLPSKLLTTYEKEITFSAELKGTAKIITKDKRLLERFFEKVLDIISR